MRWLYSDTMTVQEKGDTDVCLTVVQYKANETGFDDRYGGSKGCVCTLTEMDRCRWMAPTAEVGEGDRMNLSETDR